MIWGIGLGKGLDLKLNQGTSDKGCFKTPLAHTFRMMRGATSSPERRDMVISKGL